MTPHEFYLERINKGIDVDGAAGVQCVDLFKLFLKYVGKPNPTAPIGGSGYAKEIYLRRAVLGYLDYFDEVPVNAMQDGDWAIWGNCTACPDSHVAMFRKDNGNGTGIFLGQNQAGRREATQINITYSGIIGVLRPKCYASSCKFKSSGSIKALFDSIRVRTEASTSRGDTGLMYNTGMILNYNEIVEADGWFWAKYRRSNGGTGYCALQKTDGSKVYWKQN